MSAIDRFVDHNTSYAADFHGQNVPIAPSKQVAVVACMDSRMSLFHLLGLGIGDAHVIRNAGGVVTDDVIRSLMLSQRLLGTREVMLIHHTDCGLEKFSDDEMAERIERETGARPTFALESFRDVDDSVRRSMARIVASPFVAHKDEVRGFVYEVETGRLREVR